MADTNNNTVNNATTAANATPTPKATKAKAAPKAAKAPVQGQPRLKAVGQVVGQFLKSAKVKASASEHVARVSARNIGLPHVKGFWCGCSHGIVSKSTSVMLTLVPASEKDKASLLTAVRKEFPTASVEREGDIQVKVPFSDAVATATKLASIAAKS